MYRNLDVISESQVEQESEIYFIEISSNIYLVKKCRDDYCIKEGQYVTAEDVAFTLNNNYKVSIKSITFGLISNFQVDLSWL